uniref:KH domain containing, RNA binding, signal transduction associated 2 n=1 Tax=Fundulus heteroclitus TaxID=8078 RepID=A0A3Q2R2E7_FUNHE
MISLPKLLVERDGCLLALGEPISCLIQTFYSSPVSQFNFVGKLLGPRGNSMKRLQEETGVKMSILGKGSMRDKEKCVFSCLCQDRFHLLLVKPSVADGRQMSFLSVCKTWSLLLSQDYNDEIRQEQLRELSLLNGSNESDRGRSAQGRSVRSTTTASTIGLLPGRGSAAPRGTAAATHSKLPTAVLTRDLQAPRTRGAAANAGYRPPLLAVTHESYDEYGYEDGYDEEYEDESYETYDENYSTQSKSECGTFPPCFAEEEWTSPRPILKAPALRLTRGGYRKHPYGRY